MKARFVAGLGAHRIRLLPELGVWSGSTATEGSDPKRIGRAEPIASQRGFSGAVLRKTVGEIFQAGAKLGLRGPLLARNLSSITQLMTKLAQTHRAIEEGGRGKSPQTVQSLRSLPAHVLGSMSDALEELDPAGCTEVISDVLDAIASIVRGVEITAEQLRALERTASAASHLQTASGKTFGEAAREILATKDDLVLQAATRTLVDVAPTIAASGGAIGQLFLGVLRGALRAAGGEPNDQEISNSVAATLNQALTPGQVQILTAHCAAARAYKNHFEVLDQAARQGIEQIVAQHESSLGPLKAFLTRANELTPTNKHMLLQQLTATAAPPDVLRALAVAQLSILARSSPPDAAADQLTQLFLQLANAGVPGPALFAIGSQHVGKVEPQEVAGTLSVLKELVSRDPRIAALDADALVKLADSLIGVTRRYSDGDPGPMNSLSEALLNALGDPKAMAQVVRHGASYSAQIPLTEEGGVVNHLRASFAADVAAVGNADLDLAVIGSAWPRLPADSIPRLVAMAQRRGVDIDGWLADLDRLFASVRGSKDHERTLRTLLVAIDQNNGDPIEFVTAVARSKLRMTDVCKLARYMNVETNFQPSPEYVAEAVEKLRAGTNLVYEIEDRMHSAVREKLQLGALLQGGGDVKITDKGLADVQGPLAPLFSAAAGKGNVNQDVLKGLLKAALADRVDQYRFETPPTEKSLACLTPAARELWMEPQRMTHIRFEGDGEEVFKDRLRRASLIGAALLERLVESCGPLADLTAKRTAMVDQIRQLDKVVDRKKRGELFRQLKGTSQKTHALEWATTLAGLTPDNITPERFERLALPIQSMRRTMGPGLADAMEELAWTIRLSDVTYSRVVTDDGPDLPTMYAMTLDRAKTGGGCLTWPGTQGEAMAYWVDPNKRMLFTKSANGQERRVVMRLVERQDDGHVGEPMLILEKTYPPFEANHEEKRRLIEHLMRRASSMKIACGFAKEYYWDASQTSRFAGHQAIADMNQILIDLSKRYGTDIELKEMKVLTRMGNTAEEYLDSDPPQGQRGVATNRRWNHNFQQEAHIFENDFVVLVPNEGMSR